MVASKDTGRVDPPITRVLARLERVKQTGSGQFLARCPAHDDGSPSLSIRDTGDGTVLMHCFAQCTPADVLAAIGLEMADLFPRRVQRKANPNRRGIRRVHPLDALRAIDHEARVVAVVAADVHAQRSIDGPTWQRLCLAVSRIGAARELYR